MIDASSVLMKTESLYLNVFVTLSEFIFKNVFQV